jgi:Domain of unknown function (DUF4440)
MSRIIMVTVAACSILQAGLASGQSTTDKAAIEDRIVANEKAISEAFLKNDPQALHSLVVPDVIGVSGQGVARLADLDTIMKNMQAHCKTTKDDFGESKFHWLNESTVVYIYRETTDRTCNGQPDDRPAWASTVWVNQGGKWLAAFHQQSEVTPPPSNPQK